MYLLNSVLYRNMRHQVWLYAAFASSFILSAIATNPIITRSKEQVTYCGKLRCSVEDFYNIRFAYDTPSERRFALPVQYSFTYRLNDK